MMNEDTKRLYKVLEDATLSVKIRKKIEKIGVEEAWKRLDRYEELQQRCDELQERCDWMKINR